MKRFSRVVCLLSALLVLPVQAEDYLSKEEFLASTFGQQAPKPKTLWLKKEHKEQAMSILGHPYKGMRVRYWAEGEQSSWILEEIGKERPIKIGVAINAGKISRVDILAFRESRGWEVRYPFFTEQFEGVSLKPDQYLDRNIDGITGATLSVRAVTNVARLALYLSTQISEESRIAKSED